MKEFLLVCLGGGIGTGARYAVGKLAVAAGWSTFPIGTILINALGSLLLATIAVASLRTQRVPEAVVLMLTTGVMGGFTTYSTFNLETLHLIQQGRPGSAALNVTITIVACLGAGVAGIYLGNRLP
ncbi:MAG TPA: CrcB family protein [Myxococcota bacterium]|nr:CrcB family protein [Myxococcota bacterium]